MKDLVAELRASIAATLLLAVLCCGIYPAVVWAVGRSAAARGAELRAASCIGRRYSRPGNH